MNPEKISQTYDQKLEECREKAVRNIASVVPAVMFTLIYLSLTIIKGVAGSVVECAIFGCLAICLVAVSTLLVNNAVRSNLKHRELLANKPARPGE